MLIKIVDDDQVFAKKIESMVYDGFKDIFLDYSIDCITSHFEDRYFEKGDIFFLDIDLKEKNGIKIAEKIRENNSNAIIIFVSAMNDMIFDSLIVQPFYFIRKDNFDRDMKIACTLIQKYINKNHKIITFDFNGKKVLVTGASSGVGREVAILLSAMGAKVVIVARRETELQKTLSLMEGSGHSYRVLDLTDFDGIVETVKDIIAKDGEKLDYIAHCAGLAVPIPLRSMSLANISQIFSSNTYSFMALLKCVAQKRLFNDGGAVVGISSCVGVYGQAANAVYGASKGAMDAFMKSAAKELRPRKIRVNTICPCGIKTEMLANQAVKAIEGDAINELPDYLMLPDKIASIVVALLSDSMQYISGVAIDVDEAKTWED